MSSFSKEFRLYQGTQDDHSFESHLQNVENKLLPQILNQISKTKLFSPNSGLSVTKGNDKNSVKVERIKIVEKNFDWGFTKHQWSDVNCSESITCKLIWEQFLERLIWSPWIYRCWERMPPLLTLRVALGIGTLVNSSIIWDVGKAHHHVLFDTSSFSLLHNQILLIPSTPLHFLLLTSPVSESPGGSYVVT